MDRVSQWLHNLGMGQYAQAFADNAIDMALLPELDSQDLKELGVTALGDRKRLLKAIAELVQQLKHDERAVDLPAPEAERRQLTVLFCDLVDSTGLSVRFDPEDLSQIFRSYRSCCVDIIKRFGGNVAQYLGDGVLVYFGFPQADEYDAERAIQAGLEIVQAVSRLELWPGLKLQSRIGIATGMVVIGDLLGAQAAEEPTAIGDTPNLAARLQAIAQPDSVIIGSNTKRLAEGVFEYDDLGYRELKGFAKPIRVWRVISTRAIASRFEATRTTMDLTGLVGRQDEINVLLRCWQQAQQGAGQVLLLHGEAGIGKSRLTQALRERVADDHYLLLRYFCSPYFQSSALYPIINQLERAARFAKDDPPELRLEKLEQLIGQAGVDFAAVAPLFAALLSIPSTGRYPLLKLSPQKQKEETLAALLAQPIKLAARRPLLILFEDMHWVDPTTLELLQRFIGRIQRLPVLLVMTARLGFSLPGAEQTYVATLTLNRLTRAQSVHMVTELAAGKTLPSEVMDQIIAKTDGVPLFIEEFTKMVIEAGLLKVEDERYVLAGPLPEIVVPSTLQDSLMARLDRLAPVKEVAQIGAVLGREFSYELLRAIVPLPDAALRDALEQLGTADVINRHGEYPQARYMFKHALVQDAAYNSMLRVRRQALHVRIAQVLEQQFPTLVDTEPEFLAHHYAGAKLTAEAVKYWCKAGERAVQRSANAEAIEHFKQALKQLQDLPDTPERAKQELQLQILLGPTLIAAKGYATAAVEQAYARAQTLCQQVGDTAQQFLVLRGIWSFHLMRASYQKALEVAEQLLALAQSTAIDAYDLEANRTLGVTLFFQGEFVAARRHLEASLALYDRKQHHDHAFRYGHDPAVACYSFAARALWCLGYPEQALAYNRKALSLARALAHPFSLAQALTFAAHLHHTCRETGMVRKQAEAALTVSRKHGFPLWSSVAMILRGCALTDLGGTGRSAGIAGIREGLEAYQATSAKLMMPWFLGLLGAAYGNDGQATASLEAFADAVAMADNMGEGLYQAELYRLTAEQILQGNSGEAVEAEIHLLRAVEIARRQQAKSWELRAATSLARLWSKQGRRKQAHELLAPVYDWFGEGLQTKDLQDAKMLLTELTAV